VHPNPATEETLVYWDETDVPVILRLYAADGRLIRETDQPVSGMSIQFKKGTCFLVAQWGNGKYTTKCIVFD
jgi:hypothetical protein